MVIFTVWEKKKRIDCFYLRFFIIWISFSGKIFFMAYREPKIEKLYYSIGEVASMFDVNTSLIRFWEKEFEIIKPKKNKKGNRLFTRDDVDNFHIIFHLVKENGMTLKGAQKKMKDNREDTLNNFEVIQSLNSIKNMLLEIKDELE